MQILVQLSMILSKRNSVSRPVPVSYLSMEYLRSWADIEMFGIVFSQFLIQSCVAVSERTVLAVNDAGV